MYREISCCRVCGNTALVPVLDLGLQCLTGVFPRSRGQRIPPAPLELVKCADEGGSCGLVQLRHSCDKREMYGDNYGYRSGLNKAMVAHLKDVAERNHELVSLTRGDLIIDIGSNDGTLLNSYAVNDATLVGIDPTAAKFRQFYPDHVKVIADFFSPEIVADHFGTRRAKIVSSIAMFYDLESPLDFVRQIYNILDAEGIWALEQSYLPLMLQNSAYDTICHEHLEYYSLKQIKWMLDRVGFKIVDLQFNDINGGSFKLIVDKRGSSRPECSGLVARTIEQENLMGLSTLTAFHRFREKVEQHRTLLLSTIGDINNKGGRILGYGASTKGNVILQYCGLTEKALPYIAEVNEDKLGSYTPGTYIPIISERDAKAMKPDYFLVLPWHFRRNFLEKEREYLKAGGRFVFPLPEIETVGHEGCG